MLIRIVHHLSSSGGTVISKCLASMPGTVLLSEVHPLVAQRVDFFPIDPLGQLVWNYPDLAPADEVLCDQFRLRLKPVIDRCSELGRTLILRDHSHSDYLTARQPQGRLVAALQPVYPLRRMWTIRDPLDAWLSMRASQFDGHLQGFDDYCRRVLKFVRDHEDIPSWRYEDFVADPGKVLAEICDYLDIAFDADFEQRWRNIVLTGDSGRKPEKIAPLPSREMPADLLNAASASRDYQEIAEKFGYSRGLGEKTARAKWSATRFINQRWKS